MGKLTRAISAYAIATATVIPVAWVADWWLYAVGILQHQIDPALVVAPTWLLVVGAPSMAAAADNILRVLGKKPTPWVRGTNARSIPINALGDVTAFLIPGLVTRKPARLDVADGLLFGLGDTVVDEREVHDFLYRAWRRQRRGEPPLSRTWWVDKGRRIERGEYEVIVRTLDALKLIKGRKPGASGRLRWPPARTLVELKHRFG